jgi:hypothetical protein
VPSGTDQSFKVAFAADVDVNDACYEESCQALFRNHPTRCKYGNLSADAKECRIPNKDKLRKKTDGRNEAACVRSVQDRNSG